VNERLVEVHFVPDLLPLTGLVCASLLVVPALANSDKNDKNDAKASQQAKEYQRPTDPSLYVGSETCKTCHEDMPSKDFFKNYESSLPLRNHARYEEGP
jgi:hypothetical protein